ncbi:hypothetical protein NXY56_003278 [Leishmania guyanensis]
MFSIASHPAYGRAHGKRRRSVFLLGVALTTIVLVVIGSMFINSPIISEDTAMINNAYVRAHLSIRGEWVDADTRFAESADSVVVNTNQLLQLYRLRVFVVATEQEVRDLTRLLNALSNSNYSTRMFPIDITVHVLGNASAVPFVPWSHGRLDVYTHRLHSNASASAPLWMADLWQPQSDFELGMLLTASARVSPHWFQWVISALQQYGSVSAKTVVKLDPDKYSPTERRRLLSPLSKRLSGLALGMPVAGAAAKAVVTVVSAYPSATSIFTASYWKSVMARAGPGTNVDDTPASWPAFLRTATTVLGHSKHRFLYPPLGKYGPLVCENTNCAIHLLSEAQLAELVKLPMSEDQVPLSQE